jgi:ABC-type multidrug transport system ATPase subunit
VAFLNQGQIVASDTPRKLKIAYGRRTLVASLADQSREEDGESIPPEITLSMDDPADLARLARLMQRGVVQSIHSQEATLEEVFIAVAGVRPA